MTTFTLTREPEIPAIRIDIADAPTSGGVVYQVTDQADTSKLSMYGQAADMGGWDEGGAQGWVWYVDLPVGVNPGDGGVEITASGLRVGNRYEVAVDVSLGATSPTFQVQVVGVGVGAPSTATTAWQTIKHYFFATTTTQVIRLVNAAGTTDYAGATFDNFVVTTVDPDPITITRTDSNGTEQIRSGSPSPAGVLTHLDTEAAPIGNVTYTVFDGFTTLPPSSTVLDVVDPQLRVPENGVTIKLEMVQTFEFQRHNMSPIHYMISRSDPLWVRRALQSRTGTLVCWVSTLEKALEIEEAANMRRAMALDVPEMAGLDMHFIPNSVLVSPLGERTADGGQRWSVDIQFTEVAAP